MQELADSRELLPLVVAHRVGDLIPNSMTTTGQRDALDGVV